MTSAICSGVWHRTDSRAALATRIASAYARDTATSGRFLLNRPSMSHGMVSPLPP
ncbi:hypothetical protein [Achromobacter denitrificans]|uniref:hypothetical protein n=1 Tax=Achromobacter denitrificans TaxID=32002 RepID=UPI000B28C622|nr:hypothetical protein [Achromobacter denitrificans]QKH41501.1 hypothetical protein FOC82_08480 [Achromobacter denitrificans]QKH51356.1 hypothetical protein FOC80_18675 [Achromobacter denitrificans]